MPPETDPSEFENKPVLTDPQNWASRSHQELYAAVHNNNDPGQAGQISSDWGKYGSELTEASRTINAVIAASESKWTGAAAEAARDAMKKLGTWVDETAKTAVEVGNKVADQGRVMEAARAQMPAPVQFDWNKAAAALSQPGTPAFVLASADIAVANAASRAAHDQAVNVMTTMESNSRQIDTSTPTFKPPFNPNTGQVEEPVMAMQRMSGAPTLNGGVDGLMSTQAAGGAVAAPPSPSGANAGGGGGGAANAPAAPAAYTPSAPGYTPSANTGGGGGGYTPQNPNYNPSNTNVAAATYTPSAPGYTPQFGPGSTNTGGGGGGSNYTPQFGPGGTPYLGGPGQGGNTPRGGANVPKIPVVGKDIPNPNYNPQNPNAPKGMTPGGMPGGGGGGGGAGMKPGAMPNFGAAGGGAGGFGGGPGGAAGGGGSMQPGGTAGVQGRAGGMPMGMTGPGGATAAGAGAGAGAPMGGAPGAGGKGEDDKEHRSASYIMGGDLFEIPGENLPPSVIGGAKVKKPKGTDAS
ncbi:PPE domain-containing protein [Lentzea sp. NPDC006480]|uniref:PPE domain-containing protein n=1 Tax=Lentzea sp. NPDC006480 TaxID=3157176 RepID=UPI0033B9BAF8